MLAVTILTVIALVAVALFAPEGYDEWTDRWH